MQLSGLTPKWFDGDLLEMDESSLQTNMPLTATVTIGVVVKYGRTDMPQHMTVTAVEINITADGFESIKYLAE